MAVPVMPVFNGGGLTDQQLNQMVAGIQYAIATIGMYASKPVDQSNNATTTLASDNDLVLPVLASATYDFELFIRYSADAVNDFKWQFLLPSGSTWRGGVVGLDSGSGTAQGATYFGTHNEASSPVAGGIGSGNTAFFLAKGRIITSTTAGTAQFRFAQNATGAPDICTARADSYMLLRRIA